MWSLCLSQPCFSDKTNNLEAYVKWFNRLCYLVATEICMVRWKLGGMTQHSPGWQGTWPSIAQGGRGWRDPPGRESEGYLEPVGVQGQDEAGHLSGTAGVTQLACSDLSLWSEPGTDPLDSSMGHQRPLAEGLRSGLLLCQVALLPPSVPVCIGGPGLQPCWAWLSGFRVEMDQHFRTNL